MLGGQTPFSKTNKAFACPVDILNVPERVDT